MPKTYTITISDEQDAILRREADANAQTPEQAIVWAIGEMFPGDSHEDGDAERGEGEPVEVEEEG